MQPVADSPESLAAVQAPLGSLLAAERERLGMSRAEAAQRLHMSAWQIEALENNDYTRLPTGTFLRGFVRNYAKALGLDPKTALSALAHAAPSPPAQRIVVPSQNIRFDPLGERLASPYVRAWGVAGVAFALAMAAIYWWQFVRPAPPAATLAARKEAQHPLPRNLAATPVSAPEPVAAPREAPKVDEPKAEPPGEAASPRPTKPPDIVPVTVAASTTARPPGTRTVTLRFKGNSWVEIRDRSGKVLLSQLNRRGSEAEVFGRPPFTVVVGNAPDVTMLYDDREFPLEPHTKVAVARFTLE